MVQPQVDQDCLDWFRNIS